MSETFNRVYEIVSAIPRGKVLTYGLISNLMEGRLSAQGVGWALNSLKNSHSGNNCFNSDNVPWHRVINSKGMISTHKRHEIAPDRQRKLLEAEGVIFEEDRVDLEKYLWKAGLTQFA